MSRDRSIALVLVAARRLRRALRRIATTSQIDVLLDWPSTTVVDVDFHGLGSADGQEPPAGDIKVSVRQQSSPRLSEPSGSHGVELAAGRWDGRGLIGNGRLDEDAIADIVTSGDFDWGDIEEIEGRLEHDKSPTLPFPEGDIPYQQPKAVLHSWLTVQDASADGFAKTLDIWIRNIASQISKFETIDFSKLVRCEGCKNAFTDDEMAEIWGSQYCEDCVSDNFFSCDGCGEWSSNSSYDEDSERTYCESCANVSGVDLDSLAEAFYSEYPDLEEHNVLENAASQHKMEPDIYVTIFNELPWHRQYGGRNWAHIAETWRDLLAEQKKSESGSADWAKMLTLTDHAFDLAHNNGSLFTKASSDIKSWLFDALEQKALLDPLLYRDKVPADVRKLLDLYVRYQGGVEAWQDKIMTTKHAMEQVEKKMEDDDDAMAARLWKVHNLTTDMFRGRPKFLEVAFWSVTKTSYEAHIGGVINQFMERGDRKSLLEVVTETSPSVFMAGTPHPAGSVLRGEFLPKALKLIDGDIELEQAMSVTPKEKTDEIKHYGPEIEKAINSGYMWNRWVEFFNAERRRSDELAWSPFQDSVAVAFSSAIIKLALSKSDFYGFYALSAIDCSVFPDEIAKYCGGLKKTMLIIVGKAIVKILERAVVREARHVGDPGAMTSSQ